MERLFTAISHRAPLPEPDGLVDSQGNPIPNTESEAKNRVAKVNAEAQEITNLAIGALGIPAKGESGIQPLIEEPFSTSVIETNAEQQ